MGPACCVRELALWAHIDIAAGKAKSSRLNEPSSRLDLSRTGMCGAIFLSLVHSRPTNQKCGVPCVMSALPLIADEQQTFWKVRFVPILLQKSVEGCVEQPSLSAFCQVLTFLPFALAVRPLALGGIQPGRHPGAT